MNAYKLPIDQYDAQLAEKVSRLQTMMTPFTAPDVEVFRSPVSHYRMRAEFRIWHDGDDLYHIIFDQATKQRIRVDSFPAASELINQMMPRLMAAIRDNQVLRFKLFQIDYLSTLSNQIVISLLYHRKLEEEWHAAASALRDQLRAEGFDVQLIGRATKTKICLDRDYVDERLPVAGKELIYRQVENSFTQPNAAMNRVLATEIAEPSVASAQYNIAVNQIDNVQIIRMAAEEFTQAMNGVRSFNRLEGIDLSSYQCETIFVDPPRSGLDDETVKMVQAYPRILYISCNPQTLCDNLAALSGTHQIERLALFDQFPYTHHMECGVLLTRRFPFFLLPASGAAEARANPEHQSRHQNDRNEVRADIRIFCAHHGAIDQNAQQKKCRSQ